MQSVMIFIDEANCQSASRTLDRRLDLVAMRDYLADPSKGRILGEAVCYMGFPPNRKEEDMPVHWKQIRDRKIRLKDALEFNGFMTVVRTGKAAGKSSDGRERFDANVDVLMAQDCLELALDAKPDIVVLVTGDQDFAHLAHKLRRRGIRVEAAGIQSNMAAELKKAVNSFIDLADFFANGEGTPIGTEASFFEAGFESVQQ